MPRLRRSIDLSCPRRGLAHGKRIRNAVAYLRCMMYDVRLGEFGSYAANFFVEIIVKNATKTKKRLAKRTENGKLGFPFGRISIAKNEGIIGQAAGKTASFSRKSGSRSIDGIAWKTIN